MSDPNSAKYERITRALYRKITEVVLQARCGDGVLGPPMGGGHGSSSAKWFNLDLPEREFVGRATLQWKQDLSKPMVVSVYIAPAGSPTEGRTLLERWTIALEPNITSNNTGPGMDIPSVYKKAVVLVRSIYSYVRALPAYRIYHAYRNLADAPYAVTFSVMALPLTPEVAQEAQDLTPGIPLMSIDLPFGRLLTHAAYKADISSFIQRQQSINPDVIITDYVSSHELSRASIAATSAPRAIPQSADAASRGRERAHTLPAGGGMQAMEGRQDLPGQSPPVNFYQPPLPKRMSPGPMPDPLSKGFGLSSNTPPAVPAPSTSLPVNAPRIPLAPSSQSSGRGSLDTPPPAGMQASSVASSTQLNSNGVPLFVTQSPGTSPFPSPPTVVRPSFGATSSPGIGAVLSTSGPTPTVTPFKPATTVRVSARDSQPTATQKGFAVDSPSGGQAESGRATPSEEPFAALQDLDVREGSAEVVDDGDLPFASRPAWRAGREGGMDAIGEEDEESAIGLFVKRCQEAAPLRQYTGADEKPLTAPVESLFGQLEEFSRVQLALTTMQT